MALSDYERQILSQMEAELQEEDPKLASVLTSSLPETNEAGSSRLSARNIALGSIVAIAGLAIVVIGVSLSGIAWSIALGIVGFAFMVGGVLWALKPIKVDAQSLASGRADSRSGQKDAGGFMDKQRERWQRRQNGS